MSTPGRPVANRRFNPAASRMASNYEGLGNLTIRRQSASEIEYIARQVEVKEFLSHFLNLRLERDIITELQDGVYLCQLALTIDANCGITRVNRSSLPMKMIDNISNFLEAARKLGVKASFAPTDLRDRRNPLTVLSCVMELANVSCVLVHSRCVGGAISFLRC